MTYDYIIVGAGSAGATLASRLSEDASTSVLLLEAGPDYRTADNPEAMQIPNPFGIIREPAYSQFRYDDLVAKPSARQEPRQYWRGRGMGGSSCMNGQIAIRGMLEDFDEWEQQGSTGWSGEAVLPYFNKLETDLDFGDKPYHGSDGPIPIYRAPLDTWGPIDTALRNAALDLGYPWTPDCNEPKSTGISHYPINSKNGVRVSTSDAYLEPARGRPNLTIFGDATVNTIAIDGKRATGVDVRVGDERQSFKGREIVVAAGAIHSPPLLMRSGIGPAAKLQDFGIDVLADLPVGVNLVEHSAIWLGVAINPEHQVEDVRSRHTNCCVRYSSELCDAGKNDMMLVSMNLSGMSEAGKAEGLIIVCTYQTFSRGCVTLASTDPVAQPNVNLNMLSDERDLIRMRDGFKRLFAVSQHDAVQSIADRIYGTVTGETVDSLPSDDEIDAWLLNEVTDAQHPVGTCRMGSPDDPRTVVDPGCNVLGIEGLRVVDASIMPENPRANTHLTTVMIAEKLADELRNLAA